MINQQVIERLKQKKWYAECQTKQEVDLVLHACDDAEIKEESGEKATKIKRYYKYPIFIGYPESSKGIEISLKERYEVLNMENITDWFFNAIKNNDGKLTPQNAKQEYLIQILLAMMQKIPVECNFGDGDGWTDAGILYPNRNYKYRIKSKPITTPLPISRELWSYIDKRWRFIAIDKSGTMYLFLDKPTARDGLWLPVGGVYSQCPLNINTDGINWETSLTERPEGV